MTKLFLDCEFNGFNGALISMALVNRDGKHEFYEVVECAEPIVDWVKDNVMPILYKDPIPYKQFQTRLQAFLFKFSKVSIYADWPDDIKYFCQSLIVAPGQQFSHPPITFTLLDNVDYESVIPHNALEDAIGIKNWYNSKLWVND